MAGALRRSLLAPQPEAAGVQGLDDLVDRLLAEVRDRTELGLALGHQVTDGLDAGALEAVVGADAELELLDQDVVHRVRLPATGRTARAGHPRAGRLQHTRATGLPQAVDRLFVGEDRQL